MKAILHTFFVFLLAYPKFGSAAATHPETGGLMGTNGRKSGRFLPTEPIDIITKSKSDIIDLGAALRRHDTFISRLESEGSAEALIEHARGKQETVRNQIASKEKEILIYRWLLKNIRPYKVRKPNKTRFEIESLRAPVQTTWVKTLEEVNPHLRTIRGPARLVLISTFEEEAAKGWLAEITGDVGVLSLHERWADLITGGLDDDEFTLLFQAYVRKKAIFNLTQPQLDLIEEAEKIQTVEDERYEPWKLVGAGGTGAPPPPRSLDNIIQELTEKGWTKPSEEDSESDEESDAEEEAFVVPADGRAHAKLRALRSRLARARAAEPGGAAAAAALVRPRSTRPEDHYRPDALAGMGLGDESDDDDEGEASAAAASAKGKAPPREVRGRYPRPRTASFGEEDFLREGILETKHDESAPAAAAGHAARTSAQKGKSAPRRRPPSVPSGKGARALPPLPDDVVAEAEAAAKTGISVPSVGLLGTGRLSAGGRLDPRRYGRPRTHRVPPLA